MRPGAPLAAALLAAGLAGCLATPSSPLPAALPLPEGLQDWTPAGTDFAFEVDPDARVVRGEGTLRLRNELGRPQAWVRLVVEPYAITRLKDEAGRDLPHRVEVPAAPLPFRGVPWPPLPHEAVAPSVSLAVVNVTLDGDVGPGAERVLAMAYEGWGARDRVALGGGSPNDLGMHRLDLQPTTFHPFGDEPAAPSRFTLRHPEDWVVLATAEPAGTASADGWTETAYVARRGISTMVAARGLEWREEDVGGVAVRTYFFPDMRAQGGAVHDVTRAVLTTMPALLGPYPFEHLWTVPNSSPLNALSRPGLTFLGLNFYRAAMPGAPLSFSRAAFPAPIPGGEVGYEAVVVHEHVHNWWFSNVRHRNSDPEAGPVDWWVVEGVTTYLSEFVWAEVQHGTSEAALAARDRGLAVLRARQANGGERVVTQPGGDYYSKAALSLRALEGYAIQQGRPDAVLEGLRLVQQRHGLLQGGSGTASTAEMVAAFEEVLGQPLGWHFEPWLMGTDLADFRVQSVARGGGNLTATVANAGAVPAAVHLKATTLSGRELWGWGFVPAGGATEVALPLPPGVAEPVVLVEADPWQYVYEVDDTDNTWTGLA